GSQKLVDASRGIDWDCSGSNPLSDVPLPVPFNINHDFTTSPSQTPIFGTLLGYNDLAHLNYSQGVLVRQQGIPVPPAPVPVFPPELTVEADNQITKLAKVSVVGPGEVSVPFGTSGMLPFVVRNSGVAADTYDITVSGTAASAVATIPPE